METMIASMLFQVMYPTSLFNTVIALVTAAALTYNGLSEIKGKNLQYSKFWNVGTQKSSSANKRLSSQTGMLVAYMPALLFSLASFAIYPNKGLRFILVKSAFTLHFFKRVLEVLFLHKYSSAMFLDGAAFLSFHYFINTASMIHAQNQALELPELPVDLKYAGVVMFLMGLSGNFYHHYLLSRVRDHEGDREYKIPKGGLFNLVICPHYLFEILGFVGITFIAQTLFTLCFTIGTTILLVGRSYATRKWYLSKLEDFPKKVKLLIPFVF